MASPALREARPVRLLGSKGPNPGGRPTSAKLDNRCDPVVAFLREAGLVQYAQVLRDYGFDDMETLMSMEDEHMREMNIPTGHILKLKRRLHEHALHNVARRGSGSDQAANRIPLPRFSGSVEKEETYTTVQMSWLRLKKIGLNAVGGLFYKKFFQMEPDAKRLFPMSMRWRYRSWDNEEEDEPEDPTNSPALRNLWAKFITVVGSAVAGIQDCGRLVPMLQQLGIRHAGYGLKEGYFHLAGKVLIQVVAEWMGSGFTKEVENAWVMVSSFMVATMLSGYGTVQQEIRDAELQFNLMLETGRSASDAESTAVGDTEAQQEDECDSLRLCR